METFAAEMTFESNFDSAMLKRLWPEIDVYGRVARAAARADAAALFGKRTACAISA